MSDKPPIGGRFEGREWVIESFDNRKTSLSPGFEYQELAHNWFEDETGRKVLAEFHERSWLPGHPDDVLEVRTCSVLTFTGSFGVIWC